ncbi:hypothetical protein AT575_05395 [Streptococcus penaeicida]|uniref:Uncharacterized protein n=1 Tax=Streptococcus penaeicida TaxID=1765960 RepID=A0A2N8LC28_9STRE|nr:hypothetical protein [Streptococcus penaeicida]PND47706.1 hypothetical protein AT575_05395 [Streptococcus penaeicida]
MNRKIFYLLPLSLLLISCASPAKNTTSSSKKTDKIAKTNASSNQKNNSSQVKNQQKNEDLYADILASYPNQYYSPSHAFYDINHDGVDELIIGKADFAEASII